MAEPSRGRPFKIGDRVRFVPDAHACGWAWPSFDRFRFRLAGCGIITRITDRNGLYLDDERGGFHWECFEKVKVGRAPQPEEHRP